MWKVGLSISLISLSFLAFPNAKIDAEVIETLVINQDKNPKPFTSIFIFINSTKNMKNVIHELKKIPGLSFQQLNFMPALVAVLPNDPLILNKITANPAVKHIALNKRADEKIDLNPSKTKILATSSYYPGIKTWWKQGYKGRSGIIGLIDSGVASEHPALANKKIIIQKRKGTNFANYVYGVRSAHGTGVACIYAGKQSKKFPGIRGIAYETPIIISGLAGVGDANKEDFWLTFSSLNTMLKHKEYKPSIINYSFGNGDISCSHCPDWSGFSKVVDYIVNQKKIIWVTSAGNAGFITAQNKPPFASTMTVPADNFNALTIANMNLYARSDRNQHAIRFTSSRGPTVNGRKKPDLTAPGNNTRTCAPNPRIYHLTYTKEMDFHDGYRLMGGTSSAAPHVGGAILLLQEAGIKNPMAIKALLINSADTWTDSHQPGPDDPNYSYKGGHYPIKISEWNPTYGWGYINMQTAYKQRNFIIEDMLSIQNPVKEYKAILPPGGKITLVHERRVGYHANNKEWELSQLSLEIYDTKNHKLLAEDKSAIDSVHQLANCRATSTKKWCNPFTKKPVLIRVQLLGSIDGASAEPFALALSAKPSKL